jgi:hypothetical protein
MLASTFFARRGFEWYEVAYMLISLQRVIGIYICEHKFEDVEGMELSTKYIHDMFFSCNSVIHIS